MCDITKGSSPKKPRGNQQSNDELDFPVDSSLDIGKNLVEGTNQEKSKSEPYPSSSDETSCDNDKKDVNRDDRNPERKADNTQSPKRKPPGSQHDEYDFPVESSIDEEKNLVEETYQQESNSEHYHYTSDNKSSDKDGKEGNKDNWMTKRKADENRPPKRPRLTNVDRSSAETKEITVNNVTVIITEYKAKKKKSDDASSSATEENHTDTNSDTPRSSDLTTESSS